jgi:DNA repair exonuclease SbcCD ATPase subunit
METRATGLLQRASELYGRRKPSTSTSASLQPQGAEDEGITAEERREIIASIDKVASRNRISASTGSSSVNASKKGFVFPLVVNLLVFAATAASLLALALIFKQRDQNLGAGSVVVTTAEGKLIQEIKRESDSKLQEKDKAIAEIQDKLGSIDKQRSDLAASLEQRVGLRETELRAALKAELDQERLRLSGQGLSESAVQDRLKRLEAQKTSALDLQLESFKKKAEADKAAEDARLAQARDEYQKSISSLNDERKKIQGDAKTREDQLRASLDATTKELEGQSAAAKASLAKAQSDLSRLEDQRSKAQAAEDRILGLYGSIRNALRERRFEDALASVSALTSYLNDPTVLAVPSIQARREADLFVTDALGSLARAELEKASVDTTKLLGQAELVAAARDASAAGDRALKSGDPETAAAKYQESLATVPEILAAHDYFIAKAKAEEAARQARLDAALGEADRAWKAGDYAASDAHYAEALALLPLNEAARSAMIARLGQAGADSAVLAGKAADSKAARDAFAAANLSLSSGKWSNAIAGYIGLIGSYPSAEQIPEALKGIAAARSGMDRDSEARAAAYEKTIADLRSEAGRSATGLQEENKTLAAALQDAKNGQAAAEKKLSDAESRLKASQDEVSSLQKRLAAVQAASAQASVQAGSVKPSDAAAASAGDAKALAELRAQVGALKRDYAAYIEAENGASGKTGDSATIDRQKRLVGFLGGPEFKALFPELDRLVDSQISDYQQLISLETLRTAADIAIQATKAKTLPERQASLDANAKHYAGDPTISNFIGVLRDLLNK